MGQMKALHVSICTLHLLLHVQHTSITSMLSHQYTGDPFYSSEPLNVPPSVVVNRIIVRTINCNGQRAMVSRYFLIGVCILW